MVGFGEGVLRLLAVLVEGLVHVLWNDLLDADGPRLHGGEAQGGLDVGVLLEDVEWLSTELVRLSLEWSLLSSLVLMLRLRLRLGLGSTLIFCAGHVDACFLEFLLVLDRLVRYLRLGLAAWLDVLGSLVDLVR